MTALANSGFSGSIYLHPTISYSGGRDWKFCTVSVGNLCWPGKFLILLISGIVLTKPTTLQPQGSAVPGIENGAQQLTPYRQTTC